MFVILNFMFIAKGKEYVLVIRIWMDSLLEMKGENKMNQVPPWQLSNDYVHLDSKRCKCQMNNEVRSDTTLFDCQSNTHIYFSMGQIITA